MSRQVLPIVPPVLDCPLAVSSFRGPWCDPSPPGESERMRTRYGDPVENLARLHATPCRAKFTGAEVIHKGPFDLVGIEGA